ncbi:MAG: XRE family transcriptional regulator [Desulfurellales bacterium]|nr:MAG: XRE family transcriptional regulator [Desulfurellales bacterium]
MEPQDRLSAWLKSADITAAELARRCEYDPSNMNKIVKGVIRPSLDMAFKIEAVTGGAVPASAWARAA